MSYKSLEDALRSAGSAVDLVRNSQIGPYVYPVVPPEFTNWRDEQRAWRETCGFFNQSHHMTDLYIEGPDTLKVLSDLSINSFKNFAVNKGKQFVACNYDGYVIGDAILFYLDTNRVSLVGRPSAPDWVQFHCETAGYDVSVERDERSAAKPGPPIRKFYRYQVQGPSAVKVLEKATGASVPEIRFFNMGELAIAGHQVRALRHGMVGQPGFEMFGPWDEGEEIRAAILAAGQEYGIRQVGAKAYSTTALESGWIPSPLPAVYTGDKMKPFRQWLSANSYEATGSLGGSFYSDDITNYYLTPYELGYGSMVKFDHDFIGREALEKMDNTKQRQKVTLAWNGKDAARAFESLFTRNGDAAKFIDLPLSNYASWPYDKVLKDGGMVGISTFTGYSYNERSMLSLAMVEPEYSQPGTQVTLIWGEEAGGSRKPVVERHAQIEIRATVGPAPYSEPARTAYRPH